MAVSRGLSGEEYTLLTAFMGVLVIISLPLSTLSNGFSHHTSLLVQSGRTGDVRRLLTKWLLLAGIPSVLSGGIAIIWNAPLAALLHLDRAEPVIIVGAALPALFWLAVLVGAGQGLQLFGWCSSATIGGALVRLGLGAGFVWFVYPACGWAMLGHSLGIYTAAFVLLPGLWQVLRPSRSTGQRLPSMRFYLLQCVFIQSAYAILMNADVILVKHFLPDDTDFAYAATLGRLVAFLPGAIVMAMFPKVASYGAGNTDQHRIFLKAFWGTALMVMVSILGCVLFPRLFLRIIYGMKTPSDTLIQMVAALALVMGFSAMLNVVLQYLLAQRRFRIGWIPVICAGAYIGGVVWRHTSSWDIMVAAGVGNLIAVVACLIVACQRPPSEIRPA
ncbi:MAG TPA: hypothetical protein DCS43_15035 [Verrucomicrobia bacterium]|nr:hypothetical protein [Verrucomicrobiota bacterium]